MEDQVATFRLASGSGPVHLSGTHQTETNVIADDDDFGEEGEDDDEDDLDDVEDSPVIIHSFFIMYEYCFYDDRYRKTPLLREHFILIVLCKMGVLILFHLQDIEMRICLIESSFKESIMTLVESCKLPLYSVCKVRLCKHGRGEQREQCG